jgi:hypothetical protein
MCAPAANPAARRVIVGFAAVAALLLNSAQGGAQTVNMSRDLVSLGIAATNLVPNDRTVDARPLFQRATEYARRNVSSGSHGSRGRTTSDHLSFHSPTC